MKDTILPMIFALAISPVLRADDTTSAGEDPLQELVPPMTATGSKVTGSGDERKCTITVKNTGKRSIAGFEVAMYFLAPDGSVENHVPHTHTGELGPGETTSVSPHVMFMEENTASVSGVVNAIEFGDGSRWPPMPAHAPARAGEAPVGVAMIGVIGKDAQAQPAIACYNHGDKDVASVMYSIEFLDAEGKKVAITSYGYHGPNDDPFMKSGTGAVLSGGDPPPEGTTQARLSCTKIIFADESVWQLKK